MKPGRKSTEFVLTLIVILAAGTAAAMEVLSAPWAASISAGATAVYTLARTYAKTFDNSSPPSNQEPTE